MSARVLYGPNGAVLPSGIGRAVQAMSAGEVCHTPRTGREQALDGWRAPYTSADGSWQWSRTDSVNKVRDLLATEPWAQGGVDRKLDMVVGASWRPSIKPDAEALGISDEVAAKLGQDFERAYRNWGEDPLCRCDAEETLNASWLLHLAVMEEEVTGDGVGVLRWRQRHDWPFRTAIQIMDSDRLSNPMGKMATPELTGGIEKGAMGEPVAYHFQNSHPADMLGASGRAPWTWERVERREPWGRPKVLHLFEKRRPGQSRGISKLVAGLARFKQLQRFAEGELANAVINALFAATITSGFDPAQVQQHMSAPAIAGHHDLRNGFYGISPMTLGGARVQHLFPGDKLEFNAAARDTANFDTFTTVFLRSIASSLGISYEQLTMDWSQVNYSSARAALVEVWRGIMKTRSKVAMMFATPMLLAVIEDAVDIGMVDLPRNAPGLYEMPAAYCRGSWIGPPRGWVDPVKEAQAALMRIEAGLSTWEAECAEQGQDFEVNLLQLARERKLWDKAGLMPPALAAMLAVEARTDSPETTAKAA